jgi:hypothetical protein
MADRSFALNGGNVLPRGRAAGRPCGLSSAGRPEDRRRPPADTRIDWRAP